MKEYLLEHKGYKCIAKLYEDGRWGFGSGPQPTTNSEFPFFWYADNIEEAKARFAASIDRMIEQQEYKRKSAKWKEEVDYKTIAAVVNILPDVFEKRIQEGHFDKILLQQVKGGDYVVPLYYVTKAWDNLLKGSLGTLSFMIGPEEDDDFSEEELQQFLKDENATRSRGEAIIQNDMMKEVWKKYFRIDIDALNVDFTKYDMHLPPKVSRDEYYWYFDDVPDGVNEWILHPVNYPSTDWILHDFVSCLMEFTANVIQFERFED